MKRIILTCLAALFLFTAIVSAALPQKEPKTIEVTVQENETLWSIASKRCSDDMDIREYIYDIQQLNHITSAGSIQPGQVLKIPVKE